MMDIMIDKEQNGGLCCPETPEHDVHILATKRVYSGYNYTHQALEPLYCPPRVAKQVVVATDPQRPARIRNPFRPGYLSLST